MRLWLAAVLLAVIGPVALSAQETAGKTNLFRIGFAGTIMTQINENDARAAVKVWADSLIKELGIQGWPIASVMRSEEVVRALNHGELDAAVLTTPFFLQVDPTNVSHILVASHSGQEFDEYLLLVHQGTQDLGELRGKSLAVLDGYATSLALPWLDVALAEKGLPRASEFFGALTLKPKPTQVVLPVFFRSVDACLVHRRAFEVMVELNPQVGRQLSIIACSPRLISGVCCISARYQSPIKEPIIQAILHMNESTAGRQIHTVFQFGELVQRPASCLQSARELLDQHARLMQSAPTAGSEPVAVRADLPDPAPVSIKSPTP